MSHRTAKAARAADRRLLERYHRTGDTAARDALVARFERLTRHLARRYHRGGDQLDDLCQVAAIGLLKAIDGFDPERGTEFGTFATPTIVGEIKRHFRTTGWLVHVPRGLQELAVRVSRVTAELEPQLGRPPTPAEIAERAEVSVEEVLEARQVMEARYGVPLERPADDEDAGAHAGPFGAADDGFGRVEDALAIEQLLSGLDASQRELIRLRYRDELVQKDIAERVGSTQVQVSRGLRKAVARLSELADAA